MVQPSQDRHVLAMMRKLAPKDFHLPESELKKSLPFYLPDPLPAQICSALNSGKHVIFVGGPGTGKTTVAQAVARAGYSVLLSFGKGIYTTATADWTTTDTVGGYIPDVRGGGRLIFTPGIITRAILDNQWLVIDEINRADIDKAIGPFFSILSNHEAVLPYKNSSGVNFAIRIDTAESTETEICVHPHWRLIATMNDFDKMSLFKLSYAFFRRFAIIRIATPKPPEMIKIISSEVPTCNLNKGLSELIKITQYREVGAAIYLDMARYIINRSASPDEQTEEHTREALELCLLPQVRGLPRATNIKIAEIIRNALPGFKFDEVKMEFVND